jgi:hypothetical protein
LEPLRSRLRASEMMMSLCVCLKCCVGFDVELVCKTFEPLEFEFLGTLHLLREELAKTGVLNIQNWLRIPRNHS